MKTVAVLDYGMSNLHSVNRALEYIAPKDWQVIVSDQAQVFHDADKVVFPGQGASGKCMDLLRETGLDEAVREAIQHKPFLGICLGLQTLLTQSEENNGTPCLDLVQGTVKRFNAPLHDASGERLKIPHMGWSPVQQTQAHPLWQGIEDNSRFYFVHSYYAAPEDESKIAGMTEYPEAYTSAVAFDNVFAVQFHPEKSQHAGLQLLTNFLKW
ncbi:MAG: imidazole glycerol phosphate synthase subunit HisH [Pseudomonadota bacterium]